LVVYKQFDLVVDAFNELGLPLKIIGIGPELKRLKSIAKDNIEFLGLVSDEKLADLYSETRALVFPQEEDFGLVPLEAMASGRPVIAFRGGGALETIIEGKTGIFFDRQEKDDLVKAIDKFDKNSKLFSPVDSRRQAEKFSIEIFRQNLFNLLEE
jgi:glycosyltransferase involved in cell wall biosynthesis